MSDDTPTAKSKISDLARFGGPPLFASPRPIGQLEAPPQEEYLAYLRAMVERRRLTNDGPLVQELEAQLAAYHGVHHCIALANAGLGLIMLMQIFSGGRQGEVVMPAFTFRGLPHFARWAGQQPRFADIDLNTQTLSPVAVEAAISERTTAILAVCNFNSPGDIDGLAEVAARHDLPLFFDSVYGVGTAYRGRRLGSFGRAEVFSLHATKLINGFEGGYVTTNDAPLARQLRYQRNFCYGAEGDCSADMLIGLNAKLNEPHAAMALLSLARIDETIGANGARFEEYATACAGIPGLRLLGHPVPDGEPRNYSLVVAELAPPWPLDRDLTLALLRAEGLAISAYYSPPLNRDWPDPPAHLPVTEILASRFLQLPAGHLVSRGDIEAIGALLRFLARHGPSIRAALAEERTP
ncbi:MAG: aminotransferase class I/II-fold pyridoxal phosphate-dependent enzyme [Rhodocyclales bacterium]|nr:aminotransferase class I/II-fold pyridoxal phosphate-dependent enzyme [Rhodocyclales bacterium]